MAENRGSKIDNDRKGRKKSLEKCICTQSAIGSVRWQQKGKQDCGQQEGFGQPGMGWLGCEQRLLGAPRGYDPVAAFRDVIAIMPIEPKADRKNPRYNPGFAGAEQRRRVRTIGLLLSRLETAAPSGAQDGDAQRWFELRPGYDRGHVRPSTPRCQDKPDLGGLCPAL